MHFSLHLNLKVRQLTILLVLLLAGFSLRAQPTMGSSCVVDAVQTSQFDQFKLEQRVLMADGSMQRVLLALPKYYMMTSSAHSGARNLYLLRKQHSDSTALLLTDSLGRVLQLKRLAPALANTAYHPQPQLIGLTSGRGFVLFLATKKAYRVLCLTADISPRWTGELPVQPVLQLLASETHLWALQLKTISDTKNLPLVHTFDLATGQLTFDGALQPKDDIEAATLIPEGLLVLGNSHVEHVRPVPEGQTLPSTRSIDFFEIIKSNGAVHFAQALVWPAGKQPAFHWQTACQRPDGSYQLVGQTFRRVLNGEAIALAAIGGAMLGGTMMAGYGAGFFVRGNYVNEKPTGLILAQLQPFGRLTDVHTLTVPAALPATLPPVDTAAAPPKHSAAFSGAGFSPDHRFLVLSTDQQVLLYAPDRHELRPLVAARPARPTVLAIEAGRALVGWAGQPNHALPDYEWVAWP